MYNINRKGKERKAPAPLFYFLAAGAASSFSELRFAREVQYHTRALVRQRGSHGSPACLRLSVLCKNTDREVGDTIPPAFRQYLLTKWGHLTIQLWVNRPHEGTRAAAGANYCSRSRRCEFQEWTAERLLRCFNSSQQPVPL